MTERTLDTGEALLAYPPIVRSFLTARDITTPEEAEVFLSPDWERDTHDPFLMKGMQRACERIVCAIERNETIAIWSDYDMDGIPGAVVLWDTFRALGYKNVVHHTPHRNIDGFGLNKQGLAALAKDGVRLVITVDCGIGDTEMVAYANTLGLDVIITDHHLPGETLPDAHAVLNPKQNDCAYPEPMLCGAGVAFKLTQGLLRHVSNLQPTPYTLPPLGWEKWLLDMVGMATIADMVPLTGENRVFAHYGLVVLRKSRRPGLQALLKKARARQQYLTEEDVGFTIAPRINAASRMGHAKDAFRLLASDDLAEAGALADELERINAARKGHVAAMVKEARSRLEGRTLSPVIVLGNPEWKPSLLGLVAGNLAEEYERPVFLWGREEGTTIKGSCRSYNGANLFAMMQKVETRFIEYGGHAFSGGFSIGETELFTLEEALSGAHTELATDTAAGAVAPAFELSPDEVTWDLYRALSRCGPFGTGNPRPVLEFRNVHVAHVRTFGKTGEHMEIGLERERGGVLLVIAFFTSPDKHTGLAEGVRITLRGHIEASYFKRTPELRLRLVDIQPV